ncbi:reverse transcriptase/maturase family protein [Beggiatoa sp. PS]|nr:reverse transcriptase/maturase family protein [Beggiatoa sp. PS]
MQKLEPRMKWAKKGWDKYKAKPAKRKYVPKANGQLRHRSIPTQEDRVIQHVVKSAIEPFYEAQFESNSIRGSSFSLKNLNLEWFQTSHE